MQLIYLFENSLIMYGPYLVFVLLQLLILALNEDLIAIEILTILFMEVFFNIEKRLNIRALWSLSRYIFY